MSINEIQENLVYLTKHLSNLAGILVHLEQEGIFSRDECEEINNGNTTSDKNYRLLTSIQKKDWDCVRNVFLETLRNTNNEHCANEIEGIPMQPRTTVFHPKILKSKWWPNKKQLTKSLHKRKIGSRLLVEELHGRILKDENRMVVITESADASKYSGMGGVGKTLTAKWYAHHYEEYYDHILWIDCGEGSLLQSFKKLVRDLEIKNRTELVDVEDYSIKSYEKLVNWKCLWIFDNSESYQGGEGIIKVLPVENPSFSCLITSRSRDWGVKNVGFGKISDLQLDIFSEEESLEFLRAKLDKHIKHTEFQLKDLCRLLGNLPLAMELALSALNSQKINLKNYIKKTQQKDLAFVGPTFDNYEKTINKNIKISLDMILEEDNGQLAHEILMIFGYIRPDDIPEEFLQEILDSQEIEAAIELLIKYSLISKHGSKENKSTEDEYSSDRDESTEDEENSDKDESIEDEENYSTKDESTEDEENSDMDESIEEEYNSSSDGDEKVFLCIHRLLQQVIRHNGREMKTERETLRKILGCKGFVEYKLIPFTKYTDYELKKEFPKVKAELLDQHQLMKLLREGRFEESLQLAKFIHEELKTRTTKFNYAICLDKNGQVEECVNTLEELVKEKIEEEGKYDNSDENGILKLEVEITQDLVFGHLLVVYWRLDKRKVQEILEKRKLFKIIPSDESLDILIRIVNSHLISNNYSLTKEEDSLIELNLNAERKKIKLRYCSLSLSSSHRLSVDDLTLEEVYFIRDGKKLKKVTINEYIDLNNISRLKLEYIDGFDDMMQIDLSAEDVSMEYLHLRGLVRVLNWQEARWNVQTLKLEYIPYVEKSQMKIKKLCINSSNVGVDIWCLPQTIEELQLEYKTEVFGSEGLDSDDLPLFKYLTLVSMDSSSLFHFSSFQLTHVHFRDIEEVNLDLLPQTISQIKISRCLGDGETTRIVRGFGWTSVEKLILEYFSLEEVEECLSHFETENLVIYYECITPKELLDLMEKDIMTIVVGVIDWDQENNSDIASSHVDKKTDLYLLEGGRGREIEYREYLEFMKYK